MTARQLRPYQREIALAILDSVFGRKGLTFSVEIARYNPDYLAYVEAEKKTLGEDHPLFLTQYRLQPIHDGSGFLNIQQRAQIQGEHGRKHAYEPGKIYIAGIDLSGEAEEAEDAYLRAIKPRQDSTVVTIGEVDFTGSSGLVKQPRVKIV